MVATTLTPGLVSVVVASYNHTNYLERRMESLIGQTYQNIEILVIDDCSPENNLDVLRKYESNPKVKLFARKENGGWVVVFNQGSEMSAGEFILFANCDDECDPRMVERLVEGMRANPSAGICYCRSLLIDEEGNLLGDDFSAREKAFRSRCASDTLLTRHEMGRFLLHSCVIPNTSSALIRRECLTAVGQISSDYRVCSDWQLYFNVVSRYDVAYLASPLNKFRQHAPSITGSTKGQVIQEEYARLLLGQIRVLGLSRIEKARYRTRVMYLWASYLLAPSFSGLFNFTYQVRIVATHDWVALIFFPIGILHRIIELLIRIPSKLFRSASLA
ncbi:MAG: glycosyltransferase [Sulfuritalea sp.]|jgi:glycosyltransferase involved in cell wall biosynthesis|nr:glycosyltransferase [Sulfuritalea sp.]